MTRRIKFSTITTAIAYCLGSQLAHSQDTEQVEEIVVWGRSLQLLGNSNSASQGVVG